MPTANSIKIIKKGGGKVGKKRQYPAKQNKSLTGLIVSASKILQIWGQLKDRSDYRGWDSRAIFIERK